MSGWVSETDALRERWIEEAKQLDTKVAVGERNGDINAVTMGARAETLRRCARELAKAVR